MQKCMQIGVTSSLICMQKQYVVKCIGLLCGSDVYALSSVVCKIMYLTQNIVSFSCHCVMAYMTVCLNGVWLNNTHIIQRQMACCV